MYELSNICGVAKGGPGQAHVHPTLSGMAVVFINMEWLQGIVLCMDSTQLAKGT